MNSTLLAQLVANSRYNRQTNVDAWYAQYVSVLETLGWIVQKFQ